MAVGVLPDYLLARAAGLLDFRLYNYTFLPLVAKENSILSKMSIT